MRGILIIAALAFGGLVPFAMAENTAVSVEQRFEKLLTNNWQTVMSYDGSEPWQKHWALDGEHATVSNGKDGFEFSAGPDEDPAHHAVLWTKKNFAGDLKIEYDYTRLDESARNVTILYIQATGELKKGLGPDIHSWSDKRRVPHMWMYYKNMHLYHISYAAFDPDGKQYIRARRYMAGKVKWPDGTALEGDLFDPSLFKTGVKHRITVIKQDRDLWMRVSNPEKTVTLHWENKKLPPVLTGWIGLRHMFGRSARYANFSVSVPAPDPATAIEAKITELESMPTDVADPVTHRASFPLYYGRLNLQHGMHHQGTTYFTFHGGAPDDDDPYVMAYHHGENRFTGPVKVDDTPLPDSDDHGNPGLIVDDAGHVHVIFGGHGVSGQMRHFRTTEPGDILNWQRLKNIPTSATYPKLLKMSDGTIYYTFRAGNHREDHKIMASTDHGVTFSKPVSILAGGKESGQAYQDRHYAQMRYYDSWYTHTRKGVGDTIHMMFFFHPCADDGKDPNRALHHGERRVNLYYLKYDHKTKRWTALDGTDVTDRMPLKVGDADELCRVYKSQVVGQPGKVDSVGMVAMGVTPEDRPILSFVSGADFRIKKTTTSWLAFGKEDGWELLKTARDPARLLTGFPDDIKSFQEFSLYNGGGVYRTTDGGKSWTQTRAFRTDEQGRGVSQFSHIYTPHPDARYIGGQHPTVADPNASPVFIWGDGGFLKPADTKRRQQ